MSTSRTSRRRIWPKLLLATVVGAVFFEVSLRALLTSPWTRDSALARELGSPSRFAFSHEDTYWRFVSRLATSEAPKFEPPHDTSLGWTWPDFRPETFTHADLARIENRRAVFLFGDSYSACLTNRQQCFQGLMERSPLSDRCRLVNYGVCGYGFDQICLLTRAVAERFEALDPVIVVGLLVDDDLSRMLLTLREYPKPRLRLEDGRVTIPDGPVRSRAEYLADPDALPASWALTWVRQALRAHPLGVPNSPARIELEELTRALLTEVVSDLRARDLDFYFMLFHTAGSYPAGNPGDWRSQLVCTTLDELQAPWYDVREEFARRLAADGGAIQDFYIPMDQPGGGHYDGDGNAAAFAVLLRGLADVAGLTATVGGKPLPWAFQRSLGEGGGTAAFLSEQPLPFERVPSDTSVVLRAPGATPVSISYALGGHARRYKATLWAHQAEGEASEFALTATVDGNVVWVRQLRATDEPLPVEIELDGAQQLELRLEPHVQRAWVVLSEPVLE